MKKFLILISVFAAGCGDFGSSKMDLVIEKADSAGDKPKCEVADELDCDTGTKLTYSECCFDGECSKELVSVSDATLECGGSVVPSNDDFAPIE